jgi:hypothetical protein
MTADPDSQASQSPGLNESISDIKATQDEILSTVESIQSESNNRLERLTSEISRLKREQVELGATLSSEIHAVRDELLSAIDELKALISKSPAPAPTSPSKPASESSSPSRPAPSSAPPPKRSPEPAKPGKPVEITDFNFPFDPSNPLEGIISGLSRQAGGNVADLGVVDVTASGCLDPARFLPKNVADVSANTAFVSVKGPNQWIAYNFKTRRVRFTHYAIRSRHDGWINSNNPKDWAIEVSPEGRTWTEVDRRRGNNDLNAGGLVKAFELKEPAEGRFVRLILTGPAHSGKEFLAISGFELFGVVIP